MKALENLKVENHDQKTGVDIVRKAIQAPARQIVDNAGADGAVVVGKLLEAKEYNFGYDAQTGEYGDLVKLGIIDPTKVVRTALQDAASIAGLIVTTEATITEHPKKERRPCLAAAWAAWITEELSGVRSKKRRGPGISRAFFMSARSPPNAVRRVRAGPPPRRADCAIAIWLRTPGDVWLGRLLILASPAGALVRPDGSRHAMRLFPRSGDDYRCTKSRH